MNSNVHRINKNNNNFSILDCLFSLFKESFKDKAPSMQRSKSNRESCNISVNMKIDFHFDNSPNKVLNARLKISKKVSDVSLDYNNIHVNHNLSINNGSYRNNNCDNNYNYRSNRSFNSSYNEENSSDLISIIQETINKKQSNQSAKNTLIFYGAAANKNAINQSALPNENNINNTNKQNNNNQIINEPEKLSNNSSNQIINNISVINNNYNKYKTHHKRNSNFEKTKKSERRYKKQMLKFNILYKIVKSTSFSIIAQPKKNAELKCKLSKDEILPLGSKEFLHSHDSDSDNTLRNNVNCKITTTNISGKINLNTLTQLNKSQNALILKTKNKDSNFTLIKNSDCNLENCINKNNNNDNVKQDCLPLNIAETELRHNSSRGSNSKYLKFDNLLFDKDYKKDDENCFVFLVIDDNLHLRNSIRNLLKLTLKNMKLKQKIDKEFEIIEGCDGIDALKYVIDSNINSRIKGIFIDENMEYMNGSEAIKIIKNFQNVNKINTFNIVTVTAFEDPVTRSNIKKAGVDYILQKPLNKHNLEEYFKRFPIC